MTKDKEQAKPLRWGFSTGACMCALALALWQEINGDFKVNKSVLLCFLDGRQRHIPLLPHKIQGMTALQKDGGDDPDCTHKAIFYGKLSKATLKDAGEHDYTLQVGEATLIVHALEGIGICTRPGLDCEIGKWAINSAPRHMLIKNLAKAGMQQGVWLFSFGVVKGEKLAKQSLNRHLGIVGGISVLGSTGLVRPFSHAAYVATINICVRSQYMSKGSSMVFCTGGRTKKGAQKYLPNYAETAFACIADFIGVSIQCACAYGMEEIVIACMPGKLCKYAAGFENTHAHKVQQDMSILCNAVKKILPNAAHLHHALQNSVTVREALLSIPEENRLHILEQLAEQALQQWEKFVNISTKLRILLFDFQGNFLFEKSSAIHKQPHKTQTNQNINTQDLAIEQNSAAELPINEAHIHENYFLEVEQCKK